ncbi:MAG: GNAT family N-acetyltransferase, partial [Aeromonas hydrophila]
MHHTPPLLRTATHNDMHAIWQIDAKVFVEDVYPAFFFRQAMDLWPELLLVAEY